MEKKYKSGLILGKFMPFHLGHKYLIDASLEICEKLTVLVCTLPSEPIDGNLRYGWVKETYNNVPEVKVVHVVKNAPMRLSDLQSDFTTSEDGYFWDVWMDIMLSNCDDIDVLCSSESYGDEAVKEVNERRNLNIVHEIIDLDRTTFHVSGTALRTNLIDNWGFLPELVKPHFTKKIAIVGPESVGKSIMTKMLAEHYNTSYVAEYGREYTNGFDMSLETQEFGLEDISQIAAGHLFREEQALLKANYLFFADTETITTEIWSEIYCNSTPKWLKDINKVHPHEYDMYFLLNVDVPWVSDGTRYMGRQKQRENHFNLLRTELFNRGLPFAIVGGDNYQERFEKVVKGIDHYILTKKEY